MWSAQCKPVSQVPTLTLGVQGSSQGLSKLILPCSGCIVPLARVAMCRGPLCTQRRSIAILLVCLSEICTPEAEVFAFKISATEGFAPIGHLKMCTVLLMLQVSKKSNRGMPCSPGGVSPPNARCRSRRLNPYGPPDSRMAATIAAGGWL